MTVVAVGKSGFLASEVARHPGSGDWLFLSHEEALAQPGWLDSAATVVNFSFPPHIEKQGYDARNGIDGMLAGMIGERSVHYVMLSSRMVYGQLVNGFNLREEQEPGPSNSYGAAKRAVEDSLHSLMGPDRLTILRLSNIFGFEKGRGSFFGQMMTSLARDKKIVFDMAPASQRDFLAAHRFADALVRIASAPAPGIFNLGAGFGAKCGDVAAWLIEGYGAGELEVIKPEIRDQFSLDISKARAQWDIPVYTPELLHEDVLACGKWLQNQVSRPLY